MAEGDDRSVQTATSPGMTGLVADPFGPFPACVYRIQFTGTYPSGGLDLTPGMVTCGVVTFACFQDTSSYRFAYDIPTSKLRVYLGSGAEASGAITFDTRGFFVGRIR